jgi:hypothetical protein
MVAVRGSAFAVIGRDRDLPILKQFGHVQVICHGPHVRPDRTYSLFQITPTADANRLTKGPGIDPVSAQVSR